MTDFSELDDRLTDSVSEKVLQQDKYMIGYGYDIISYVYPFVTPSHE